MYRAPTVQLTKTFYCCVSKELVT